MLPTGYRQGEWRVLLELAYNPNQTQASLVLALGLDRAQLYRTIVALQDKGFLFYNPVAGSKSRREYYLSRTGRRTAQTVLDHWSAIIDDQLKNLSHAELRVSLMSQIIVRGAVSGSPQLHELAPDSFAWMIESAAKRGSGELAITATALAQFVSTDWSQLGAAAVMNGRVVGTGFALMNADQDRCELFGFYVDDEMWNLTAPLLLDGLLAAVAELTIVRATMWAASKSSLATMLGERGFVSTGKQESRLVGDRVRVGAAYSEFAKTLI